MLYEKLVNRVLESLILSHMTGLTCRQGYDLRGTDLTSVLQLGRNVWIGEMQCLEVLGMPAMCTEDAQSP